MNICNTSFFAMAQSKTDSRGVAQRVKDKEPRCNDIKDSLKETNCVQRAIRLSSPPTSSSIYKDTLCTGHKSGEVLMLDLLSGKKQQIAKDRISVTSVLSLPQLVLYGNRKGHIKAVIDGRVAKVGSRHRSAIISLEYIEDKDGDIDLISTSADKRVYVWKVIIEKPDQIKRIEEKNSKRTQKRNTNQNESTKDTLVGYERTVSLIYLKTLYGPTTPIRCTSISPNRNLLLCAADMSNVVRAFKIEKDTQLLFEINKKEYVLECVFLSDDLFLLCTSANALYLFSTNLPDYLSRIQIKSNNSVSAGVPSLLKKIDTTNALLGFTSGAIFTVKVNENKISIDKEYSLSSIPNSLEVHKGKVYVLAGKEERHSRFYINKNFRNGIFILNK